MRKFLKIPALLLCVLLVLLGAVGYAYFIEPRMLTVRAFPVETEKEIAPCRVVFFTDTHFGKYYSTARAQRLADVPGPREPGRAQRGQTGLPPRRRCGRPGR